MFSWFKEFTESEPHYRNMLFVITCFWVMVNFQFYYFDASIFKEDIYIRIVVSLGYTVGYVVMMIPGWILFMDAFKPKMINEIDWTWNILVFGIIQILWLSASIYASHLYGWNQIDLIQFLIFFYACRGLFWLFISIIRSVLKK